MAIVTLEFNGYNACFGCSTVLVNTPLDALNDPYSVGTRAFTETIADNIKT